MSIEAQDTEQIEAIVQRILDEKLDARLVKARYEYDLELRERTIRVEEELKHQRELMLEGFKQSERQLENSRLDMEKRFEQTDKQLENLRLDMEKRFEQVDKRFEQIDKRFEQIDKRFEENARRLDRFMFWSLGITVTCAIFVVNFLK